MKLAGAFILFALCTVFEVKGQLDTSSLLENSAENMEILNVVQRWQNMEKNLKKATNAAIKMLLPHVLKGSETMNISSQCMRDSLKLISGIKNLKSWALRFIDSSAKMVDGLLGGTLASLGVYDECLNTEVKYDKGKDKEKILFRGKYCIIDIKLPLPAKANFYKLDEVIREMRNFTQSGTIMSEALKNAHFFYFLTIKMGVCVPSGCTTDDMDQVLQMLADYLNLDIKTYRCEMKEDVKFTNTYILVICVFCLFGFLMLIGSLTDLYYIYAGVAFKSTPARLFLSFSFVSNFKRLVNTDISSGALTSLHGIRFLTMSWIILGHTYVFLNYQAIQNLDKIRTWGETFAFQVILNGTIAVDTFLCLGGFLVCYFTIKTVKLDGKPFKIVRYIAHRLWRIYPVLVVVVLSTFIFPKMSSGPLMHQFSHVLVDSCYKYWWRTLLFINNFYDYDEVCLAHSWYIAADFQLYIAALFILILVIRSPRLGISVSALAIIASIIYTAVQVYKHDLDPTILFLRPDPERIRHYTKMLYYSPLHHMAPYCIGLLAGYLIATKPNLKMSPAVQVAGWIVAFICCFASLYGTYNWNSGKDINFAAGIIYASLHRTTWTVGIAWMIVCCATGHGGVINYILSWKIFIPLGRLTFAAYLIHPCVQIIAMASLHHTFVPDHFFVVWFAMGDLWVSYAVAFAVVMLVEAPMISLEKSIFRRGDKKLGDSHPIENNGTLNGISKSKKNENGDITVKVDSDYNKSLGMDSQTHTKL